MSVLSQKNSNGFAEIFLGLGLGFGFLTSLRFWGPIGVPEISIAIGLLALIVKNPTGLFRCYSRRERVVKIYIFTSTLAILPIVTAMIFFLADDIYQSTPEYVASFIAGVLLTFYLTDAIRHSDIHMSALVRWFALAFLVSNSLAIFVFGYGDDDARFTGGADNPNQLTFYAATLSLLLVVYGRRLALFLIPAVVFFLLKARSDAYQLSLFVIVVMYFYFRLIFSGKLSFWIKVAVSMLLGMMFISVAVYAFGDELLDLWVSADEGDSRTSLMKNAFLASVRSPLFGFGAGSFSGIFGPFNGFEAHNTFLDFAMQFGFIYPLMIYGIMVAALFHLLKRRQFLVAAFVVGFIESGLFHFSGRHFTFWVELAVFWYYAFAGVGRKSDARGEAIAGFAR